MINVDGSYGSAGGQIIRTAIGLSAVTGKPCRISNIRAGRPKPGLAAQHLKGIEAVAKLCHAGLKGAGIGSTEIEFVPKEIKTRHLNIEIGTAGSVTLVMQTLMIPAVHAPAPVEFEISGGTHVKWSPTTGYFRHVFSEYMKMMGIGITSETASYGYFPKGGGLIKVAVRPARKIKPINITGRGRPLATEAWSNASRELIKPGVCERQTKGAERWVKLDKKSSKYVPSLSVGSSITLAAGFENCVLGTSALGEKGKSAELVGEEAGRALKKELESKATVDRHMADQLIPYMALAAAGGPSEIVAPEFTDHAKTNIWVTEKFLPVKFSIKEIKEIKEASEEVSGCVSISCRAAPV